MVIIQDGKNCHFMIIIGGISKKNERNMNKH
jgi:hypothetical protein